MSIGWSRYLVKRPRFALCPGGVTGVNGAHSDRRAVHGDPVTPRRSTENATVCAVHGCPVMKRTAVLWCISSLVAGCGRLAPLDGVPAREGACEAPPPVCVAPNADDPCGESSVVAAACDGGSHDWICPSGARVYARAPEWTTVCRPFHDATNMAIGPWGLSSMTSVPTDDGRCLWIADSATMQDGAVVRNVAFQPDPAAPFGTCPAESLTPPTPIVTVEGGSDPSILVQIDGGYRLGGVTHVLYRVFQADSAATFGAIEIGGGIGHWDPSTQRIVIPTVKPPFPWGLDLDLGDASLVAADGAHAFVWGCARPGLSLEQGCELARLDASDDVELFSTQGTWIASTDATLGALLFGAGSWTSSVAAAPAGLRHVFIGDFGNKLQSHVGSVATGPWAAGPDLAPCDLPLADDPQSFCAGPIVHGELSDPMRPGEMAIAYGVGSVATVPPGTSTDYWPRLVWSP